MDPNRLIDELYRQALRVNNDPPPEGAKTVQELMEEYDLTRPQVRDNMRRAIKAGEFEQGYYYGISEAGKRRRLLHYWPTKTAIDSKKAADGGEEVESHDKK